MKKIEQDRLLYERNQSMLALPDVTRIEELFFDQVRRRPEQLAVVVGEESLTYRALNEKSARLASLLRSRGVKRERLVGLMVGDSLWMIIAILAILRAGGAYLPLDPRYPQERIDYLLQDSQTALLLLEEGRAAPVSYTGEQLILQESLLENGAIFTGITNGSRHDLAYVIYTSGSTGQPKGVMVEHLSLLNLVNWHQQYHQVTSADHSTRYAGFGFDASVWEIFPYLCAGATIYFVPELIRYDIDELHHFYAKHQISISFLPTQVAERFMEQPNDTLRTLLVGGDRLRRVKRQPYRVINHYGPTENTVVSTCYEVRVRPDGIIPIGRPIANQQVYLLDDAQQLQPHGEVGELCIGGLGLARGYLGQEQLTDEKFIPHPFAPGERLYRTGDLARWLPDGELEYIGRIDQQVQVRGIRVEPGEIEACLIQHPAVTEVAILAQIDQQEEVTLAAYVVSTVDSLTLQEYLRQRLPDYMIPVYWIALAELPLTANDKVDCAALPKATERDRLRAPYVAPITATQKRLQQIWETILSVAQPGLDDDFFLLGGHSLTAMRLITRIKAQFGVSIQLSDCFTHSTLRTMSAWIEQTEPDAVKPFIPRPFAAEYPLSSVQRRIYALEQLPHIGCTYHTPVVWEVRGAFDQQRWMEAWRQLIERHEALRTSFQWVDGELVQRVERSIIMPWEELTLAEGERVTDKLTAFIRPFALDQPPLFRLGVLPLEANRWLLLLDIHHLLFDAASLELLQQELSQLYRGEQIAPVQWQYRDYTHWQSSLPMEKAESYWLTQFADHRPSLELPTDYRRPPQQQFAGDRVRFTLDASLAAACRRLSREHGTTLYMLFLAIYSLMVAKYSRQEEVVIGTVTSGRTRPEWESVCGMFVNTLPLRIAIPQEMSFAEWLCQIKEQTLTAVAHSELPFERWLEKLDLPRTRDRNPLFDTVFTMQHQPIPFDIDQCEVTTVAVPWKQAMFDLTWEVIAGKEIECAVEFNTSLFRRETIQRMGNHFVHLLEQIVTDPTQWLERLTLTTDEEQRQILEQFNDTKREWPMNQTVIDQFLVQVRQTPDQIAVVAGDGQLTYAELDRRSTAWAHQLRLRGIGREQIVAILCQPSLDLFVAIMAVLKAGGVYLPLDPAYPQKRIAYMLEDSQAAVMFTTDPSFVPDTYAGEVMTISDHLPDVLCTPLDYLPSSDDLAYVIYTSGSTGQPKGVMVEHRALFNLAQWHNEYYRVTEMDRSLKLAGLGFDASVWEIFPYLLVGATIYIVDGAVRKDIYELQRFMVKMKITICFLPTPVAEPFMELEHPSLRALLVGGDRLRRVPVTTYAVFNNYGPTENTVVTTCQQVEAGSTSVPIGRPIANNRVYIFNDEQQLQPVGIPGELYIGGNSLARGYLGKSDLTDASFIDDPWHANQRLYRTGDLACWLPDGSLQYIGRIDHQVQVRGCRVEVAEIERALLQHRGVQEAVVVIEQQEQVSLHAYVVGDCAVGELRRYLTTVLPEQMIPTTITEVTALPLTANGKVDYRALRALTDELTPDVASDSADNIPSQPKERMLAAIWSATLQVDFVGLDDSFFALGGDSIIAIRVVSQLYHRGWKLSVGELLQYPTIRALAPMLQPHRAARQNQQEVKGIIALTPIQRWFFALDFPTRDHWNQAVMLTRAEPWQETELRATMQRLVAHHDALRICYRAVAGEIEQVNQGVEGSFFTLERFTFDEPELIDQQITEQTERLQRSLSLTQGPLMRLALFTTPTEHLLYIVIHHLVIDGISWRILLEDLEQIYQGLLRGKSVEMPAKTHSFQQWSQQLQAYATSEELLTELPYWQAIDQCELPTLPRRLAAKPPYRLAESRTIETSLSPTATKCLLGEAHRSYRTESNDLLLAALALAIEEWTAHRKVVLHLEGHGRESLVEELDVSRTVGWFTTLYPVVLEWSSGDLATTIKEVKERLRQVPNKGIGYGVLKYLAQPTPLFRIAPEISFNYLGRIDRQIELAGIGERSRRLGSSMSPTTPLHPLEIYALVSGEELLIRFCYNCQAFQQTAMEQLLRSYREHLLRIVDHCMLQEGSNWTPSDFSASELDTAELDDFMSQLE